MCVLFSDETNTQNQQKKMGLGQVCTELFSSFFVNIFW